MPSPWYLSLLLAFSSPEQIDLTKLAKDARSKDYATRLEAYDQLMKAGPEGMRVLEPILRGAEKRAARDLLATATGSAAKSYRKWLKSEIETAREEALAIIRDRKLYPDDAHGEVGQHLVDNKVSILRELWIRPGRRFAEKVEEVNHRLYYVKEAAQYLKKAGLETEVFGSLDEARQELDEQLDVHSLMFSKKERQEIEEIREYNANAPSVATDEERRFVRILNDYRLMLGLPILERDDRLVLASRKHSQEMLDLDYFAHESPVDENRTPGMRAAKEGFSGGVLENCATARDAQGAFDGWYNSSGHHRGLITSRSGQLGIGQSVRQNGSPGMQWTMLAGSSNSLRKKTKKASPRLVYLTRVEKLRDADAETRLSLARYCLKNEMREEAMELLREVVAIEPENKKAHLLLGNVRSNGRWVTAEEKLEELVARGNQDAVALASEYLADENPALRVAAVRAAARMGDGGVPLLLRAIDDDASEVRQAACQEVGARGVAKGVGALKKALRDRSFYVSHSAAAALYRLGDRGGIKTLFAGLRSPDLNTRIDAHRTARGVFGRDFGYAWDLPAVERAKVVDDWERWVEDGG